MLIAVRDEGIKRMVYAASSSTYGDSENFPKVEDVIGKPLSPYAVIKICERTLCRCFCLNAFCKLRPVSHLLLTFVVRR